MSSAPWGAWRSRKAIYTCWQPCRNCGVKFRIWWCYRREGREEEKLKRQVRELRLADTVRFLGTRRDLPEIFRALDLLVHPSLWEGLPLALLMAMERGCRWWPPG